MLRIREDFRDLRRPTFAGLNAAVNLKTGRRTRGGAAQVTCGLRDDRVSIDENHGRAPYRASGPLLLYRLLQPTYMVGGASIIGRKLPVGFVLYDGPERIVVKDGDDWRLTYDGGFVKTTTGLPQSLGAAESYRPQSLDDREPELDPDDLSDLGNRAYGLLRPKVEKASLTQSLVEIGTTPRMLKTSLKPFSSLWTQLRGRTRRSGRTGNAWRQAPAAVSDQFLNVAFGWSPAVQDFLNVCSTLYNIDDLVVQAEANNDKWISRRYHEDYDELVQELYSQYGQSSPACDPPLHSSMIVPYSCFQTVTLRQGTRVWYEGSFKRYRPEFDGRLHRGHPALKAAEQAATLNGLRVNPTTLYRTIPYTWLVDYFASVSSGLQRLEDAITGEVVSRRFHLMRTAYKRLEYRVGFRTADGNAHDYTWVKEVTVKRRVNAQNAFGFSASPGGLTGMQYAILGALGASRTRPKPPRRKR